MTLGTTRMRRVSWRRASCEVSIARWTLSDQATKVWRDRRAARTRVRRLLAMTAISSVDGANSPL